MKKLEKIKNEYKEKREEISGKIIQDIKKKISIEEIERKKEKAISELMKNA